MRKPIIIGTIIFASIMGVMLFLANQRLSAREKESSEKISRELNSVKNRISTSLQNSLSTTRTLALLLKTNIALSDFDKISKEIIQLNPFIDVMGLTHGGIITQVYPSPRNIPVVHSTILKDSMLYLGSFEFMKKNNLSFIGPLKLKQGGTAIVGRLPIFEQNRVQDFSAVLIKMSTFLKAAGIDTAQQNSFHYQLSQLNPITKKEDFFLSTPFPLDRRQISSAIIPEGQWKLYVWRTPESFFPYSIIALSILGFCFSVLAGLYTHLLAIKSAQKKILLEENERKLSLIFDTTTDLIVLISVKGSEYIFSKVNKAFLSAFALSEEQVIDHPVNQIIPEPSLSIVLKNVMHSIALKQIVRSEENFEYGNVKRTVVLTVIPRFSREGECDLLIASLQDITELKKAEEQNAFYASIVNTSEDAIISKTLQGTITSWNRGAEKIFGYNEDEIIGKHITTLIPSHLHQEESLIIGRIKNGELIQHYETERMKKNGDIFYVSLTISPIKDTTGKIIGASKILRDTTERKKTELQLTRYAQELERSNKELEQFAYIASHDLQEPLRMVGSYVQLIEKRYKGKLDQDADQFIHFAVDGASRMKQLINDLLNYSRLHREGPGEPLDLNRTLQEVLQNLDTSLKHNNAVVYISDLPTLMGYKTQIIQLFQNLISNAIKFKREGIDPVIEVKATSEKNQWLFSIRDNGIGIDPQYADKVFVIFQQLHSKTKYGGTGIGLAIAKKVVERHGGKIWFESVLEKGTTFFFTLNKQNHATH